MGVTLTDVLLFGKAQSDDVDNATLVIYRRNILRWSAVGGYLDIIVKGVAPLSLPDAIADSLSYVKAFGGTRQGLPSGYDPVNFIYFLDGAYLQTDIVPTYDGKVEMDFATTTVVASAAILGGRTISYGGLFVFLGSDSKFVVDAFSATSTNRYTSSVTAQNNTRYKFTFNNKVGTLESGGTTLFTNTFAGTEATGKELIINGNNNNGSVTGNTEGIYLYSFKAWNNQGKLIANYVPCAKTNPLTVGLYDLVTDTFINAPTSGTWAAGPAAGASVDPTPDAPIDIVCNNGVLKLLESATGITTQAGTPTPTNPIPLVSYQNGSLILRSVGEYADSYDATTQNITRRVGVKVLDGTENWLTFSPGYYLANVFSGLSSIAGSLCTHFTVSNTNNHSYDMNIDYGGVQPNNLFVRYDAMTTLSNFKQFLADQYANGTPVTIYYPLADETTETAGSFVYADGTVETINVHGKNLIPDVANSSSAIAFADCIPIKAGTYKLSAENNGADVYRIYITTRDANGNTFQSTVPPATGTYYSSNRWQSAANLSVSGITRPNGITVTINEDCYLGIGYSNNTTGSLINWQLEQGSTATDYEPYYNGGTATAEMLLKVGNYQDVQSILDGVVTRNVGVKVLDGTESWSSNDVGTGGYIRFSHKWTVAPKKIGFDILASAFASQPDMVSQNATRAVISGHGTNQYIYLAFPASLLDGDLTTSAGRRTALQNWLADQYAAGTPVIIVYPLETPTTESVAGQTLQVQAGDNVLAITQASLDNLELEAKYQAAVTLTIQEVQDANLDPNVEVTIN